MGVMFAIGVFTGDKDGLVELKMEIVEAIPALSVNTENANNPGQEEIIVPEDKLAELPQQEAPAKSLEEVKDNLEAQPA